MQITRRFSGIGAKGKQVYWKQKSEGLVQRGSWGKCSFTVYYIESQFKKCDSKLIFLRLQHGAC